MQFSKNREKCEEILFSKTVLTNSLGQICKDGFLKDFLTEGILEKFLKEILKIS